MSYKNDASISKKPVVINAKSDASHRVSVPFELDFNGDGKTPLSIKDRATKLNPKGQATVETVAVMPKPRS